MIKTYSELRAIEDFKERYEYLRTYSEVGAATFGYERWLNQAFYRSREWRQIRQEVIARDYGCDLAMRGHEIPNPPHIHHMNPISARDIIRHNIDILDPEYLITVSQRTHNAIHYGEAEQLQTPYVPRRPGDTTLWRRETR